MISIMDRQVLTHQGGPSCLYAWYTDVRLYHRDLPASSIRLSTLSVINSSLFLPLSFLFKPSPHHSTAIAAVHSVSHSPGACCLPWMAK